MVRHPDRHPVRRISATTRSAFKHSLLAVFMTLGLSGCSYVPDVLNPIEWYRGVAGWFGDEPPPQTARGPVPGAQSAYPDLQSVPPAPSAARRQEIAEGLAAEPQPYYSDQPLPPTAPSQPAFIRDPSGLASAPPPPPSSEVPAAAPRVPVEGMAARPPAVPPVPSFSDTAPPQTVAGAEAEQMDAVMDSELAEATGPNSLEQFDATKSYISMQISEIRFGHGSAGLSGADRRKLQEVVDFMNKQNGTLRVIGHASSRTGNMKPLRHQLANFDVSLKRANIVANELIRMGVPAEKLYVGAVADSEPVYYEVMPAGEAGNRRTEIYLDY